MFIGASIPWPGPGVGCFDPAMVLHRMQDAFGSDLEYEPVDLLDGHYERTIQSAAEIGIGPDSPVVLSAARLVREVSPRYAFRLRIGPSAVVAGQVDRYSIHINFVSEAESLELARRRFVEFLRSLQLGEIKVRE